MSQGALNGSNAINKDKRDLLEVLKSELTFLEAGGYRRPLGESWKPPLIFEDSPACMNHDCKENLAPCSDCVLMQLMPPEYRLGTAACRNITLNAAGETLDSLYRYGDQLVLEETLTTWLRATIDNLEEQRRTPAPDHCEHLTLSGGTVKGTALHESPQPKCANPVCPAAFHWLAGGKFFRFRRGRTSASVNSPMEYSPTNDHGVRHYWLCESCSRVFALDYDNGLDVVLKLL